MNPRDSFWTTALHAYFWPDLEAEMLAEMCEFQCTGPGTPHHCGAAGVEGKIPTTVLPTIIRDDNVDVTSYFVLRAGRFMQVTGKSGPGSTSLCK